jgi:hypothetical protein
MGVDGSLVQAVARTIQHTNSDDPSSLEVKSSLKVDFRNRWCPLKTKIPSERSLDREKDNHQDADSPYPSLSEEPCHPRESHFTECGE